MCRKAMTLMTYKIKTWINQQVSTPSTNTTYLKEVAQNSYEARGQAVRLPSSEMVQP